MVLVVVERKPATLKTKTALFFSFLLLASCQVRTFARAPSDVDTRDPLKKLLENVVAVAVGDGRVHVKLPRSVLPSVWLMSPQKSRITALESLGLLFPLRPQHFGSAPAAVLYLTPVK